MDALVSTNIGMGDSSSVNQSNCGGAWSVALVGFLGWNREGAVLVSSGGGGFIGKAERAGEAPTPGDRQHPEEELVPAV